MSRLFISHSSQDNAEAAGLHLWLKEQGWDDVFLDVTPDRGIAAGEKWERALNEAASRCEAVLFLVSRGWLASRWCRKEYELARRLNKRLLGALIEVIPLEELPEEVTETFQMVDLASGSDHRMFRAELPRTHEEVHVTFSREGLFRLKDGLAKAGLDPRFFAWPPPHDPGRAPYRGLKPLEQEDAGIFFGREAPIVEGLDMLRGLAEAAAPRLFVVLGASGAGKSSYLRAGLLPRLARDDRTFLTLPIIRPEGGALHGETGLVAALEMALQARGIGRSRAAIRQAVAGGGQTLKPLLAELAAKATVGMVLPSPFSDSPSASSFPLVGKVVPSEAEGRMGVAPRTPKPECAAPPPPRSDASRPLGPPHKGEGRRVADASISDSPAGEDGAPKPPALTFAIDQAEELFADVEGEALLELVRDLVSTDEPEVIVLFTIRSDAYDALESAKALEGLRQRAFALLPMPRGAYQTVIEGPAMRLAGTDRALTVEPRLTQRLLRDIERGAGSDALPLLAFTLGQLHDDFGGSGTLGLADYETFGGIQGAIEAAVRRVMRAADRDPRLPRDEAARLLLLRRGLIPWLAGIDPDTGSPRRRQARLSDIPVDAEPLVRLLVEQRLLSVDRALSTDGERSEVTVEPAHEALLRQWGLLRGWLAEDFAALAILDGVKRGARDWEANARAGDWLNHTGTRLSEAEAIAERPDLGTSLPVAARDYLAGCRARDDAEERGRQERIENERRLAESQLRLAEADTMAAEQKAGAARRFMRLAVAATVAVALGLSAAGGLAVLNHFQARERDDALAAAEAGRWVAKSQGELRDDNAVEAIRSAYRAYRDRPREETRSAFLTALLDVPDLVGTFNAGSDPAQALVWLPDGSLGYASRGRMLRSLVLPGRSAGPAWSSPKIADLESGHTMVRALRFTRPDRLVAALSDGGVVSFGRDGRPTTALAGEDEVVWSAAIGSSGRRIARAEGEGSSVVSCGGGEASSPCAASRISEDLPRAVALDEVERLVAVGGQDGRIALFDVRGAPQGGPIDLGAPVTSVAFSVGADRIAAGTETGEIAIVDLASRELLFRSRPTGRPVAALAFRPKSEDGLLDLAASCTENAACLVRLHREPQGGWSSGPVVRLPGHKGAPTSLAWTEDGTRLAASYSDGLIRVWNADAATPADIGARWRARDPGRLTRVIPASRGDLVAAVGDRSVSVHDRRTGKIVRSLVYERGLAPGGLAWASDGRIAVGYEDGAVAIWPASGDAEPTIKRWDAKANPGLAWLDGGTRLAVALADGRIALADPAGTDDAFLPSVGPGADAWGLAASPDGRTLYATYVKGEIRRWEVAAKTHSVLRAATSDLPPAERGGPESLSVSPDGRWLAVTGDDDAVRLFETAGAGRKMLRTEASATRTTAFSPDGARLAALGTDGRVYLWTDMASEPVRSLAFDPSDGTARTAATQRASWIGWADAARLLVAVGGVVQSIGFDEAVWRRRAETLDLRPAGP